MRALSLPRGEARLPAFFPDATRGAVRALDARDLEGCGVGGLVMNTYHLLGNPGLSAIKSLGGLHAFTGWRRPILTDSGGFQVFSLIRENARYGTINRNEIIFRSETGKKTVLTPEKCVAAQFACGSDIMMCLDYCTHPDDPYEVNRLSVDITVGWARRCKEEYERQLETRKLKNRPLIFGIIQGGNDKALRRECAEALIGLGFDGYGFGGWPLDREGRLTEEILAYTASLMPNDKPKYAMGLGRPEGVAACHKMGYDLFDCTIPTREARHNRLYAFNGETPANGRFYDFYSATDDKHRRDARPVSELCDCYACGNYSRAYLRHLLLSGDPLGARLATIHNLRFYMRLMEMLSA
jgi:queuine tRNA-ribosyltransferase